MPRQLTPLAAAALLVPIALPAAADASNTATGDVRASGGPISGTQPDPFETGQIFIGFSDAGRYAVSSGSVTTASSVSIGASLGDSFGLLEVSGVGSRLSTDEVDLNAGEIDINFGGELDLSGSLSLGRPSNPVVRLDARGAGTRVAAFSIDASNGDVTVRDGATLTSANSIFLTLGSQVSVVGSGSTAFAAGLDFVVSNHTRVDAIDGGQVRATNRINVNDQGLLRLQGGTLAASSVVLAPSPIVGFPQSPTLRGGGDVIVASRLLVDTVGFVEIGSSEELRVIASEPSGGNLSLLNGGRLNSDGGALSIGGTFGINESLATFQNASVRAGQIVVGDDVGAGGAMTFLGGLSDVQGDILIEAAGRVAVAPDARATFFDDYVNQGVTTVSERAMAVFLGSVSGSGSFDGGGEVVILGDLLPGNSPAAVGFGGDLTLGDDALTVMELGGLTRGDEYDALLVTDVFTADGTLEIALIDGFVPAAGDAFDLFDFATFAGSFDQILLPDLPDGLSFDTRQLPTLGLVTVVPEPAGLAALAPANLLLMRRRYRR